MHTHAFLLLASDLGILDAAGGSMAGEGWVGFTDVRFLLTFVGRLLLATVLAAVLAYHPKATRRYDSLEEAEGPKSFILYAVVAAIIGTVVLKFGGIVGFVVFGIGGLLRFRTNVGSATATGRVILATVIGLCAGLDLPHVAVLSAAFAFGLVWVLDARTTYGMVVQGLSKNSLTGAAAAYRKQLEQLGCRIIGEHKNVDKRSLRIFFRGPTGINTDEAEDRFKQKLREKHLGTIEWEWR
jgi:hypothetical protein